MDDIQGRQDVFLLTGTEPFSDVYMLDVCVLSIREKVNQDASRGAGVLQDGTLGLKPVLSNESFQIRQAHVLHLQSSNLRAVAYVADVPMCNLKRKWSKS